MRAEADQADRKDLKRNGRAREDEGEERDQEAEADTSVATDNDASPNRKEKEKKARRELLQKVHLEMDQAVHQKQKSIEDAIQTKDTNTLCDIACHCIEKGFLKGLSLSLR